MRYRVSNLQKLDLTDRVAAALGDLKQLYATEPPDQSVLEEAVSRGGLVVSIEPGVAYWDGKPIEVEWNRNRRLWDFFVLLVRKARHGGSVRVSDLFDEDASSSAMANLKSRLRALLPSTLRRLIVRGTEPRSYRLDLESSKVTIIDPRPGNRGTGPSATP